MSLSRRQFLQSSAAALAAGPLLAQAPPANPFGQFTVGIQSYTFRQFNLEQMLQRTQELGLRYAELYRGHVPTTSTDDQIRAVKTLMEKYRVSPIAFGVERFTNNHDTNRAIFEFARKLGVSYLSADPDPNSFESLDKLVAEFNIKIAIHPHGPSGKMMHRWHKAEVIMPAVRNHNEKIGTCLDTGHIIRCAQAPYNEKLDVAQQIRAMGVRNYGLHLKDHDNDKRTDVVYGKGVLDVPGVLRALREVKFTGYISVEYEANPANPLPDVRACLEILKDAIAKPGN